MRASPTEGGDIAPLEGFPKAGPRLESTPVAEGGAGTEQEGTRAAGAVSAPRHLPRAGRPAAQLVEGERTTESGQTRETDGRWPWSPQGTGAGAWRLTTE